MTCQDFALLIDKVSSFKNSTVAERQAVRKHYRDCESCREWLRDKAQPQWNEMSIGERARLWHEAHSLFQQDQMDPEARI